MGLELLVPFQLAGKANLWNSWEASCPHRWILTFDGAGNILEPGARKSLEFIKTELQGSGPGKKFDATEPVAKSRDPQSPPSPPLWSAAENVLS
jgi:hypothetical protein